MSSSSCTCIQWDGSRTELWEHQPEIFIKQKRETKNSETIEESKSLLLYFRAMCISEIPWLTSNLHWSLCAFSSLALGDVIVALSPSSSSLQKSGQDQGKGLWECILAFVQEFSLSPLPWVNILTSSLHLLSFSFVLPLVHLPELFFHGGFTHPPKGEFHPQGVLWREFIILFSSNCCRPVVCFLGSLGVSLSA